jgi:carbonic anhydrase
VTAKKPSAFEALEMLMAGNQRFIAGSHQVDSLLGPDRRKHLAENGQSPFAVVLTCADSRVPPELIFDRGLGDLFVVRVAGNVVMPSTLASIEFATGSLGTPLCLVLGHSRCGAVQAAVDTRSEKSATLTPYLDLLIGKIRPAARRVTRCAQDLSHEEVIQRTTLEHVRRGVRRIQAASDAIAEQVDEGKVLVVGAIYDLDTGRVKFIFEGARERPAPSERELASAAARRRT